MKESKFTEIKISKALKENEKPRSIRNDSLKMGSNKSIFNYWHKKFSHINSNHMKRLKEIEQ